jgi:hypothetical protein
MTIFKDIESAFEAQFAIDDNLKFKARARSHHLVGLWAAHKLGLSGLQAEAYAKEVIMYDLEKPGSGGVFRKIRSDFDAKGVEQSDHQIRRTLEEHLTQALAELRAGR